MSEYLGKHPEEYTKKDWNDAFRESAEKQVAELDNEQIELRANKILDKLGLSMSDLEGKRVVDIGSNIGLISRAANQKGIEGVVSVDSRMDAMAQSMEINNKGVAARAKELPFEDESFDLVISSSAPPTITKSSEEAIDSVTEMLRVVSGNGEVRIAPAFLRSIVLEEEGPWRDKSLEEINKLLAPAIEESTEFLVEQGVDVELVRDDFDLRKSYWILRKNK